MTTVKRVENRIYKLEGFKVRILHENGRDVRGDRQRMPAYSYARKAKDGMTVKQWREQRFGRLYPGFHAEVLDGDGNVPYGSTKLGTVRETYFE